MLCPPPPRLQASSSELLFPKSISEQLCHKHFFFCACCSTVSSILGAWLDQYSEDFWTPPNYDCLHQLLSYLHVHFPGSDLERRARNLLAHFHRRQQCEPDPDGMEAGQERDHRAGARLGQSVDTMLVHVLYG